MPLHSTDIWDVDRVELATILAALRLLQAAPVLPAEIEESATDQGDFERLCDDAIDDLCERINTVSEYPWRDATEDDTEHDAFAVRVAGLFEEIDDTADEERADQACDMQMRDRAYFAEGV